MRRVCLLFVSLIALALAPPVLAAEVRVVPTTAGLTAKRPVGDLVYVTATGTLYVKTAGLANTWSPIAAGAVVDGSIVNADVNASAAIARSKIASGTARHVVVNDSGGALSGVAPGTAGNVLTSDGTTWASSAPAASGVTVSSMTQSINATEIQAGGATTSVTKNFAAALPANARILAIVYNVTTLCVGPGMLGCTAYVESTGGAIPSPGFGQNLKTAVAFFNHSSADFRDSWGGTQLRIRIESDINMADVETGEVAITVWYAVAAS